MNKAGRRVRALRGDKLPESTGGKLIAWGMNSKFPGETGLDSLGEVLICWGSDSFESLIYRRGTIFRARLPRMLVKNICMLLLGNVELCGRVPNFFEI